MRIDWFTVSAQALNFLILVWLLKRFLYKPILRAIDAREKRVAAQLADADSRKAEAQKESDEYRHKNEEFDRHRDDLISKAISEAASERQRLLDEARQAADALRVKRQDALRREQEGLNDEIIRETREEVFAIARKTLTDLAGMDLEKRMSDVFVGRLRKIDGNDKERLADALTTSPDPALLRSAFDLPNEQRAAIQKAINETFSADIKLSFEIADDVVSGIELSSAGQKIAWSIADYLASLEERAVERLKAEAKVEPKPEPDPTAKTESGE